MNRGPSPRAARVAQLIQEEVSRLLLRGLKDPRLGALITVTGAKVTPDLKEATVYYSVLGSDEAHQHTQEGLAAAAGYLQREAARNLKLKYIPRLRFEFDESVERGARIDLLLQEAKRGGTPE